MSQTFFDLREFIIIVLKKLKMTIGITLTLTVVMALYRFIPLMIQYINYDNITAEQMMNADEDFPYYYQARRTLYIEPVYEAIGQTYIDKSKQILETYGAVQFNDKVIGPIVDKYYIDMAAYYNKNQDAQLEYHYITSAQKKSYLIENFYEAFTISMPSDHIINLSVKTPNEELSNTLLEEWERNLNEYVEGLLGKYDYEVTVGQVGITVPQSYTGGAEISPSSTRNIKQRNSMSFIAARTIKGGIWGIGGGILISIVISFFTYALSTKIEYGSDLSPFSFPVIASIRREKKKGLGFINRMVDKLEGNAVDCYSLETAANIIAEYVNASQGPNSKVLLTGDICNIELESLCDLSNKLSAGEKMSFICGTDILTNAGTFKKTKDADKVIIVLQIGVSYKECIKKSIDLIKSIDKQILGFVLIK